MTTTQDSPKNTFPLVERRRNTELPPPARRREIRKKAGVPQWEMAQDLNVTALTVSKWERGLVRLKREHVEPYRALLLQLEDLIRERDHAATQAQK